jgi:hypothetical protein
VLPAAPYGETRVSDVERGDAALADLNTDGVYPPSGAAGVASTPMGQPLRTPETR